MDYDQHEQVHNMCITLATLLKDPTIEPADLLSKRQLTAEERNTLRDKYYEYLVQSIDLLYSFGQTQQEFNELLHISDELKIKLHTSDKAQ